MSAYYTIDKKWYDAVITAVLKEGKLLFFIDINLQIKCGRNTNNEMHAVSRSYFF